MDAVRATAASPTDTPPASSTTSSAASTGTASSFATLFDEAKKDLKHGEKLTKVDGHHFARIKGGERDDMCVNLSGNGRNGQAFDLIWRNGRQFHAYGGAGADHIVVEVGKKATPTTDPATSTQSAATRETTGSSDATGAIGATGTSTTVSGSSLPPSQATAVGATGGTGAATASS
jgi:hypothetical protein